MAQQTPPAATPASHRTFWTSAAGVAMSLAGVAAAAAPFLGSDPKRAALALAIAGVCSSLGALLGNVGSVLGEKQSTGALRSVVDKLLPSLADHAGPVVARAVDQAAPPRKDP